MAKKKVTQTSTKTKRPTRRLKSSIFASDKIEAVLDAMGDPWRDQPEMIRRFLEQRAAYERLCDEVEYTLRTKLDAKGIEYASVTRRAKSLESFLEKIKRKSYGAPFEEIEDFAAARVVCLYRDDLPEIETIIQDEFFVVEKVDKLNNKLDDQFGYGAIHFVVTLGENSAGARYDTINQLKCEIQTRTVLQDAWAIIQHHMVYKHEKEVPSTIQRGLNSLAGLFEVADEQYMHLRLKHQQYVKEIESKKFADFLEVELNVDTLREYMKRKFPLLPNASFDLQEIFNSLKEFNNLREVNELVDRTEKVRNTCFAELKWIPTRESTLLFSIVIGWIHMCQSAGLRKDDVEANIKEQKALSDPTLLKVVLTKWHLIEEQRKGQSKAPG